MATAGASKPVVRRLPTGDLERGGPVTVCNLFSSVLVKVIHLCPKISSEENEPPMSDASRDCREVVVSIQRTAPVSRSAPLFKVTLFRLLFVGLTAGLGSWKAVAASKNQAVTTNTLDWVIGVVLALMCVHRPLLFVSCTDIFRSPAGGSFWEALARGLLRPQRMRGSSHSITRNAYWAAPVSLLNVYFSSVIFPSTFIYPYIVMTNKQSSYHSILSSS